jgi:hypothetical protein
MRGTALVAATARREGNSLAVLTALSLFGLTCSSNYACGNQNRGEAQAHLSIHGALPEVDRNEPSP